jgi:hypothetical protein
MHKLARYVFSIGLAAGATAGATFGASCWLAVAADKVDRDTTLELKKTDPVPPATGKSKAEQAGTQEPSTKGTASPGGTQVFVNGSLIAPGAPTDTQTAPAKFSTRNADSDRLPIVAFRLKHLSTEQRQEIYRLLAEHRGGLALSSGGEEQRAQLGAEIPAPVALSGEVAPVPEQVAARFPALRGVAFIKAPSAVLLVEMRNRQVIGVLPAP